MFTNSLATIAADIAHSKQEDHFTRGSTNNSDTANPIMMNDKHTDTNIIPFKTLHLTSDTFCINWLEFNTVCSAVQLVNVSVLSDVSASDVAGYVHVVL